MEDINKDSNKNVENEGPSFGVNSIYVKDISFESPNSPQVFNKEWKPKLEFNVNVGSSKLEDDIFEVVLGLSLKVSFEDEQVVFLIELQQAGVFTIKGLPTDQLDRVLGTTCPGTLFPYAREAVSNLVTRGGFPQLIVPPMNFDIIYAQHQMEQSKKKTGTDNTEVKI